MVRHFFRTYTFRVTPRFSFIVSAFLIVGCCGCGGTKESGIRITLTDYERLHDIEEELPLSPDSIAARYQHFDSTAFRIVYHDRLVAMTFLIDSLNQRVPDSLKIDTLSIDHYIGNFGFAGRRRTTLYISSSYFIIFDDQRVLRSLIFHEFGHLTYSGLPLSGRTELDSIWNYLQRTSLMYLLRDGEYSGNARFGGHPNDSPSEMFASTYNLINNRLEELEARLQYIDPKHITIIRRLIRIAGTTR